MSSSSRYATADVGADQADRSSLADADGSEPTAEEHTLAYLQPVTDKRGPGTVELREDITAELPRFRAIREKHGVAVTPDQELLRALTDEGRVLLAITPDGPPSSWTRWGLD